MNIGNIPNLLEATTEADIADKGDTKRRWRNHGCVVVEREGVDSGVDYSACHWSAGSGE
jgi:hypothetical protein